MKRLTSWLFYRVFSFLSDTNYDGESFFVRQAYFTGAAFIVASGLYTAHRERVRAKERRMREQAA